MRLSPGTILDVQDDHRGEVLRDLFPEQALIPDSVKVAAHLASFPRISDRHFALRFQDEEGFHRKFATVDPGHTLLSALYFLKTAHQLPVEAQKVAAAGIRDALLDFRLHLPEELSLVAQAGTPHYIGYTKEGSFLGMVGQGVKGLASRLNPVTAAKNMANSLNPAKNPIGTVMTGMGVAGAANEAYQGVRSAMGPQGASIGGGHG